MNLNLLILLNEKFKGKKTYAAAFAAISAAILSYLSGEATLLSAMQLAFTGLMGATIRAGVTSDIACLGEKCPTCATASSEVE